MAAYLTRDDLLYLMNKINREFAAKDHTHSGYAASDHTHSGYAASTHTHTSFAGSITVNAGNTSGAGLVLSDDGDLVDLNDGYGSLRFLSGVQVYSAKSGGSAVIRLANDGNLHSLVQGKGLYMKDETTGTNWHLHMHGDRPRIYNGSAELVCWTNYDFYIG